MAEALDQIKTCFSPDYPDVKAVAPVVEDCLTQFGPGKLVCNARSVVGPGASIIGLHKPPLCAGGSVISPDRIALILPVSWDGEFRIDGRDMDPGSVYMVDSPNGFVSRGTNRYLLGMTMERQAFRETAASLLGLDPDDVVTRSTVLELPAPVKRLLSERCTRLLKGACDTDGTASAGSEGSPHEIFWEIQEIMSEVFLMSRPALERTNSAHTNGPRIIWRAEECFAAAGDAPLSLADLCKATGVSSSTLYAAFSEMMGMPPLRYFRMRRLNSAHKELSRSARQSGLVSRVATSFGFTELGRFSMEYRKLFGTSPSTTLSC